MKITVKNYKGDSHVLSPAPGFFLERVTGLGPQSGTISRQKMATHGTIVSGTTTDERNIVIYLGLQQPVGQNRQLLYDMFPTALPVSLHFETDGRDCWIDGYTEMNEPDSFVIGPTAQVSIICPDPFFRALAKEYDTVGEAVDITSSCPFDLGYNVHAVFTAAAESFTLTNAATEEVLTINHAFAEGDVLDIDTEERTIRVNGENCYNDKPINSPWALLKQGENALTPSEGATVTVTFTDRYIGI